MKSVCVFCGSSDAVAPVYLAAARQMGKILAARGMRLVYGAGRTGLMGAVADGALEAGGEVIGVMIPSMNTPELSHPGLTRMDMTPDMHARKARMAFAAAKTPEDFERAMLEFYVAGRPDEAPPEASPECDDEDGSAHP